MGNLLGRDLAWIEMGVPLFRSPEQMARMVRRYALRQGPGHWVWRYAWGLVEDSIRLSFGAKGQGGRAPLPRRSREVFPCL